MHTRKPDSVGHYPYAMDCIRQMTFEMTISKTDL